MSEPTKDDLMARIAQLEKQLGSKQSGNLKFKVGEKGGVSVYGLGRFPVTLYYEQWNKLLDAAEDLRAFLETNKSRLQPGTAQSSQVDHPSLSHPPLSVSKEQNESFYGLSCVGANQVKYSGPLQRLDLTGSDARDFVQRLLERTPSAHLLILPQMGLVVVIKSRNDVLAFQFKSAMSTTDAADFLASMLRKGKKINMVEKYGAIELV